MCESCGYQNNEIQSGAAVNTEGVKITLKVTSPADLNRRLVKSDYTSINIEELDFEIPPKSQKGEVTTVEGVIQRSIRGLEQDQVVRRIQHPEVANQIDEFIQKLRDLIEFKAPFTVTFNDISGNSFIENPQAPHSDPNCSTKFFKRSKDQDHELGVFTREEVITLFF